MVAPFNQNVCDFLNYVVFVGHNMEQYYVNVKWPITQNEIIVPVFCYMTILNHILENIHCKKYNI